MSDIKEKKSKKNKTKKSKLNEVNNENVTTVLPDKEIKSDIIKLEFEPYQFKNGESEIVTEAFNNRTNMLNNLTVEFFYHEKLDFDDHIQFYSMYNNLRGINNSIFKKRIKN